MLNDQFIYPYRLILGSGSPRRSQILREAGLAFEKRVISTDENFPSDLDPADIAIYIASSKAEAHQSVVQKNEIVITADTIVVFANQVLGKPKNRDEAFQILSKLSGQKHKVYTGVVLLNPDLQRKFTVCSEIEFFSFSPEEITYYIDHYHPYDKAGSYGIQEWLGATQVSYISGSFLNIMGLPMAELYHELRSFVSVLKA